MIEKSRYHHGDLRNALESAGLEILEAKGFAGLSLRAVAARAGVSHAAPAHHFGNLRGLLTALVAIGNRRFADAMAEERARAPANPLEQMRAAGRGYIAFASRHPALFRLMFSSVDLDRADPRLRESGALAYRQLEEISAPAADAIGATNQTQRRAVATLVWAATHGLAHLLVDGQVKPSDSLDPQSRLDVAGLLFGEPPFTLPASPAE